LGAGGNAGGLVTVDPKRSASPIGWSPDGQEAYYYSWENTNVIFRWEEVLAVNVAGSGTYRFPGKPTWSPDGERLIYIAEPVRGQASTLWLSDANWENSRQIADQVMNRQGEAWSPDGSQLAFVVHDAERDERVIATYDLATERLTHLATAEDLAAAVPSSDGDFVSDGADPAELAGKPLRELRIAGWSANGQSLLVLGQWQRSGASNPSSDALAVVPVDGSPPRILAYGEAGFDGTVAWSPTHPDRLIFSWPTQSSGLSQSNAYLFDLTTGPIYTATQSATATWSPDGAWVAVAGEGPVAIVDQHGQQRFTLPSAGSCSALAWNPAADLTALGWPETFTLTASTDDWGLVNIHSYHDQQSQTLYVSGELVNNSGSDQQITSFTPSVLDEDGASVWDGVWIGVSPDFSELTRAASLTDGSSLPFDFTIHVTEPFPRAGSLAVVVDVSAEPAAPSRDDLNIPSNTFDLSRWPRALQVSGTFENTGADLTDFVAVVVTAFDAENHVLGWGWQYEVDPTYLVSGSHDFEVEVEMPELVSNLGLEIYSYKIQLVGR
jgi:Tol biopolymer transport system component